MMEESCADSLACLRAQRHRPQQRRDIPKGSVKHDAVSKSLLKEGMLAYHITAATRHTKFAGWPRGECFENHSTKSELWLSHCYRDSLCCLLHDAPTLISWFLPYPSLAMARPVSLNCRRIQHL